MELGTAVVQRGHVMLVTEEIFDARGNHEDWRLTYAGAAGTGSTNGLKQKRLSDFYVNGRTPDLVFRTYRGP